MSTKESGSIAGKAIILLLILSVAGGGGWYWQHRNADDTVWQTIPVGRGDIVQAVTATGTLNPVVNVQVGSQISGIIEKLFADFNSPVKANQVVAQIDAATYEASVIQAEGELANAKASLELAQLNLKRTQELSARKVTPQATLDQDRAALHQAEAMVKVKQGSLQRAKVDFDRCTIYSPIDGIVISRSVDVGQTVAASLQAPVIFTIANDLAKMQIDANVAEADVGNIEVEQAVDFTVDAYPNRTFHGKVIQVRNAPITVQNVVSYDTVISVSNDDLKLKPGMTANASILVARRDNVLKLGGAGLRFRMPETTAGASAQRPAGGGRPGAGPGRGANKPDRRSERIVSVLRGDKPEPVQIKTGISDGIFTEIVEGLNEGDRVVIGMTGGAAKNAKPAAGNNPLGGAPRRM